MASSLVRSLFALAALVPALASQNSTAVLRGSTLCITGSAGIDELILRNADVVLDGDGAAVGVEVAPANGSTVNGSTAPASFGGVRKLRIQLGGGADILDFDALDFGANPVLLNAGPGDDELTMGESTLGPFRLNAGAGNDTVRFPVCHIGPTRVRDSSGTLTLLGWHAVFEELAIMSGPEADDFSLDMVEVEGRLELSSGDGNDHVEILSTTVGQETVLRLGRGNNHVSDIDGIFGKLFTVAASEGDDEVVFQHSTFEASLGVRLGTGLNLLSLFPLSDGCSVGEDLRFVGGGDEDAVDLDSCDVDHDVSLVLKDGANDVTLVGGSIGNDLHVTAGSGDDSVQILGTTIVGQSGIDLDGGINTYP